MAPLSAIPTSLELSSVGQTRSLSQSHPSVVRGQRATRSSDWLRDRHTQ
jgi:hypothetical protein